MSDETANIIDEEIRSLVENAENHARKILKKHLKHLHALADALLEFETLSGDEVRDLIKGKKKVVKNVDDDFTNKKPQCPKVENQKLVNQKKYSFKSRNCPWHLEQILTNKEKLYLIPCSFVDENTGLSLYKSGKAEKLNNRNHYFRSIKIVSNFSNNEELVSIKDFKNNFLKKTKY